MSAPLGLWKRDDRPHDWYQTTWGGDRFGPLSVLELERRATRARLARQELLTAPAAAERPKKTVEAAHREKVAAEREHRATVKAEMEPLPGENTIEWRKRRKAIRRREAGKLNPWWRET